jgi:Icc protein
MTIIQISDLHIPPKNELVYSTKTIKCVDTRKNFLKLIQRINNEKFDFLVFTGDLSFMNGEIECYEWIKNELDKFDFVYYMIPGNHDNVLNLANVFNINSLIKDKEMYFSIETGSWKILFLDTSHDIISENQLSWLVKEADLNNKKVAIFMHHPPAVCGCKYMDLNFPLKNNKEFQARTAILKRNLPVFCGHFHTDKKVIAGNLNIFLTPSCWVQIDEKSDDLRPSTYKIGFRKIKLKSSSFQTNVEYID